jgi:predicted aldo/keto reductase-like oxidoreductase
MRTVANKMIYRRFGCTELRMPVLTCGGMRYQQSWQDDGLDKVSDDNQANLEACIHRAVDSGINHIETARGYGTSEVQLGRILPSFPRDHLIVQTKVAPQESRDAFLRVFEKSLANLRLDYVDLLGIHGINTQELLDLTLRGGSLDAALQLQERGLVRHIGFSTHAPLPVILNAINSGAFRYVNLHWYYFDQINMPAIEAATARDMGVFIISPNDKGGRLYTPPEKLTRLCSPYTPMGFNDLFCLRDPRVHTLSIGVSRPSDFDAHLAVLPDLPDAAARVAPVVRRLEQEMERILGRDWVEHWNRGLPETDAVPGGIPVYHILRMTGMAKAFDMLDYAKMRYNLLGNGGHWFPGAKADASTDWAALRQSLAHHPLAGRMIEVIKEAHALFNAEDVKRLSASD